MSTPFPSTGVAEHDLFGHGGGVSQENRPSPLAHFFGLRGGSLVHLGPTLEALAARAPEGSDAAEWALSVALVRGIVLSVRLARWDAETETVHDDGPVVTAGPWHQAAGEGPAWVVLDLQGGEVFGCWHADEVARWLLQAVEQGPAMADDGRIWAYRTTPPAVLERMRLNDPGRESTWHSLDGWLDVYQRFYSRAAVARRPWVASLGRTVGGGR